MKRLQIVGLFLAMCFLSLAYSPCFEWTAEEYGFSSWRGTTRTSYVRVLTEFEFPYLPLLTNSPDVKVSFIREGRYRRILLETKEDHWEMLRIEKIVSTNIISAQEFLLEYMGGFEIGDYSSATNNIGDRGYGARVGPKDFVAFSRNNVFVSVNSMTNTYSAETLARLIDADILQKSMQH